MQTFTTLFTIYIYSKDKEGPVIMVNDFELPFMPNIGQSFLFYASAAAADYFLTEVSWDNREGVVRIVSNDSNNFSGSLQENIALLEANGFTQRT